MWTTFSLAATLVAALLYIPGYFFWRGFRFSRMVSLCCAPLFAATAYEVFSIAYYDLGITCTFVSIFIPALLLSGLVFSWRHLSNDPKRDSVAIPYRSITLAGNSVSLDIVAVILYIAVACLPVGILFIRNLSTPEAFFQLFDNQTHLNALRAFLECGRWSTLHETSYPLSAPNAIPSQSNVGGFYPTGWHTLAAMACNAFGCEPAVGMNATIVPICVIVLPLSTFLLMRTLFSDRPRIVLLGAFTTWFFPNWPWDCLITGPLYPNLYGLAMMPAAMALTLLFTDYDEKGRMKSCSPTRTCFILTTAITLSALVIAHPNTLFSLFIFLVFHRASIIARTVRFERLQTLPASLQRALPLVAYFALVIAAWICFYHVPLISNVIDFKSEVSYRATSFADSLQNVTAILCSRPEYLAIFAVIVPAIILVARRTRRWPIIVLPILYFALAYGSAYAGLKDVLYWTSAPWYSDPRRLALNIAVFGTPFMALVLDYVFSLIRECGDTRLSWRRLGHVCLGLTFLSCIAFSVFTGYTRVNDALEHGYDQQAPHVFDSQEQQFVKKAHEICGDDLVLNAPNDGSTWAYGFNGMNTYFRTIRLGSQKMEATLIRLRLNAYASDQMVHDAVTFTGAKYVLLLDKDVRYEDGTWLKQYTKQNVAAWTGINEIDDDTPGFELVLAEGSEMRLYRIIDATK